MAFFTAALNAAAGIAAIDAAVANAPPIICDGPNHVNVALNAKAKMLCCAAKPVHREVLSVRPQRSYDNSAAMIGVNEWEGSLPQALTGKVDPVAWGAWIAEISDIAQNAPNFFAMTFGSGQSDYNLLLNNAANKAAKIFGFPVSVHTFQYESWEPNTNGGTWKQQTMRYFHIQLAAPPPPVMPMMSPPMMMPMPMPMASPQPTMNPVGPGQARPGVPDPMALAAAIIAAQGNQQAIAAAYAHQAALAQQQQGGGGGQPAVPSSQPGLVQPYAQYTPYAQYAPPAPAAPPPAPGK